MLHLALSDEPSSFTRHLETARRRQGRRDAAQREEAFVRLTHAGFSPSATSWLQVRGSVLGGFFSFVDV